MTFDTSTLCVRTAAGDAELTLPALGLSLGQRRVLTLLQEPSALTDLAQQLHLEPTKLARDLARLVDLRLVQRLSEPAAATRMPQAAVTPGTATSMTPVVIGRSTRRTPAVALIAGIAALMVATGIWYGTRPRNLEGNQAPAALAAVPSPVTIATPGPAVVTPARTADEPASSVGTPATAVVLRGNATPPERRAEIRPGLALVAAANNAPPASSGSSPASVLASAPAPIPSPIPAPASAPTPSSALAPAPSIAAGAAPVARPAPSSNPETTAFSNSPVTATAPPATVPAVAAPSVVDPSPPVQLAAANPSPAPRPAPPMPAPLKAISREPPDFPKEAIVEGLKSGVVTARLHVDARGKVTGVDILGAQPPRVFDRAVRRALLQWQFEPPATGAATDVDVDVKFQRD